MSLHTCPSLPLSQWPSGPHRRSTTPWDTRGETIISSIWHGELITIITSVISQRMDRPSLRTENGISANRHIKKYFYFYLFVLSMSLEVWFTFVIPGQVKRTWYVNHRVGGSIWPAGVLVKSPVTEQTHWKRKIKLKRYDGSTELEKYYKSVLAFEQFLFLSFFRLCRSPFCMTSPTFTIPWG